MTKQKIIKMNRSVYIPLDDIEEIEDIISPQKKMNFNKVVNEWLQLWLKKNRKRTE